MASRQTSEILSAAGLLAGLAADQRQAVAGALESVALRRGEVLVRQGEAAEALFIVVSGRFSVEKAGRRAAVAEIGPGQPIGEIGFLTGGTRTATVRALRDSIVLRLDREAFDRLAERDPTIWQSLAVSLADRLRETTAAASPPPDPRPRTIALIRAGAGQQVSSQFVDRLLRAIGKTGRARLLTSADWAGLDGAPKDLASTEATRALNDLEAGHDYVVFLADNDLTEWSDKALRHADLVLAISAHDQDASPNALERRAAELLPAESRRLVLLHATRRRVRGTARWLKGRTIAMHHHVALDEAESTERLARFIEGTARGFVACGGGALCATHVGVYRALREAGLSFDIMGGTSAGSAMTAAFLLRSEPEEIIRSIEDMFVVNRAMKRYTWPRYSLLDHSNFDAQLERYFGGNDIEDLWLPYFAISTNLSSYELHVHRSGDLFTAVRASGSIPVLLPPIYSASGEMLVDGGLIDNVPIRTMHEMKSGPNTVVSFLVPELERFEVDYKSLPTRSELVRRMLMPFGRQSLPPAPSLVNVLSRALLANRDDFQRFLGPEDQLLVPPIPKDIGFLDWHRHRELYQFGYDWAKARISNGRNTAD